MSNLLSCFPLIVRPRNTYAAVQSSSLQRTQDAASKAVAVLLSVAPKDQQTKKQCACRSSLLEHWKVIYIYTTHPKCWNARLGWHLNVKKLSATSDLETDYSTIIFGSSVQALYPVSYSASSSLNGWGNAEQLSFSSIYADNCFDLNAIYTAHRYKPKAFKLWTLNEFAMTCHHIACGWCNHCQNH